jgi:hypothetical protein
MNPGSSRGSNANPGPSVQMAQGRGYYLTFNTSITTR